MPPKQINKSQCESTQSNASDDGEDTRGHWSNQFEFLLACLGCAIGLGNLWRFPFLCFKNGGGTFLIPYIISLLFVGMPVFFLELCIGQYSSLGPNVLFSRMAPMFKGLGISMVLLAGVVAIYYNMILAWILFYLGMTVYQLCKNYDVPWRLCDNEYNTANCWSQNLVDECNSDKGQDNCQKDKACIFWNKTCHPPTEILRTFRNVTDCVKLHVDGLTVNCWSDLTGQGLNGMNVTARFRSRAAFEDIQNALNANITDTMPHMKEFLHDTFTSTMFASTNHGLANVSKRVPPAEEMFMLAYIHCKKPNFMYDLPATEENRHLGSLQWRLVVCCAASWCLNAGGLLFGVKSMGKIVYFTTLFPFVMLLALTVRGLTLGDGVTDGLRFYLEPDVTKLAEFETWQDAISQICFSLGTGFGMLITLASYNQFKTNVFKHTVLVSFVNSFTSIIGGFAVFSTLGFLAKQTNKNVTDVVASGPSLAFIAFPSAITEMGIVVAPIIGLLLFLMLYTLGIDSLFTLVETVNTCLTDSFPWLERKKKYVVVSVCFVMFLCDLPICTQRGINVLTLLDSYGPKWGLTLCMIIETIVVVFIYGMPRFLSDIQHMMPQKRTWPLVTIFGPTGWYFRLCWCVTVPVIITVLVVGSAKDFVRMKDVSEEKVDIMDDYFELIGWVFALLPIWIIVGFAAFKIICVWRKGLPYEELLKPTEEFGTAVHRKRLTHAKEKEEQRARKRAQISGSPKGSSISDKSASEANSNEPGKDK